MIIATVRLGPSPGPGQVDDRPWVRLKVADDGRLQAVLDAACRRFGDATAQPFPTQAQLDAHAAAISAALHGRKHMTNRKPTRRKGRK